MRTHRSTQPHLLPQILWLHITLSDRLDVAAVEQWRRRLHDYLSTHGLIAAISPERIAVLCIGSAITPLDRSLIVGWLIEQAEVVFVHIERSAPALRPTRPRHPPSARGRRLSVRAACPMQIKDHRRRPSSRAGPG